MTVAKFPKSGGPVRTPTSAKSGASRLTVGSITGKSPGPVGSFRGGTRPSGNPSFRLAALRKKRG